MSTRDKHQRATRTRGRHTRRSREGSGSYESRKADAAPTEAREHYHREKARRADRARPQDHPLEQARRAYHALLASDAAKGKGGRPRKPATRPATAKTPQEEGEQP